MNDIPLADHLFLLIGSNPLPNYVSLRLQAAVGATIYFIHSNRTKAIAERLQETLKVSVPDRKLLFSFVEVKESDADNIYRTVYEKAKPIMSDNVCLNYTGGKKVMAVQAHRAIRDACGENHPFFSYLDSSSLSLLFDGRKGVPQQCYNVRDALQVKLKEEILALHGVALKRDPAFAPKLPHLARLIAEIAVKPEWADWVQCELRRKTKEETSAMFDFVESMAHDSDASIRTGKLDALPGRIENLFRDSLKKDRLLKAITLSLPQEPVLSGVSQFMRETFGLTDGDHVSIAEAATRAGMSVSSLCKWLDGEWLDSFVLQALADAAVGCNTHERAMDLKLTEAGKADEKFQFDVIAMRGYQLYALSCTTDSSKGMCKLKLFEAYLRAKQLGGDEAKVGLVCLYKDPHVLEAELAQEWNVEGEIRVFGAFHLLELPHHLQKWIS